MLGRRAETLPEEELQLGLEEAEQVEAAGQAETEEEAPAERTTRAARRRANRGALPAHLPRIETLVDVASMICPGCSGTLHRIGEDVARAARHRASPIPGDGRPPAKYACRTCEDMVVQAAAPARLIEGGLPTEAIVAQVLVSKYADHLPLYRQAQIYARQGINLDRSTLADWVGRAAFLLRPVHERLLDRLKASSKLFADETTAPVLDPGCGRTKTGQLWAYVRDDRAWGGRSPISPASAAPCRSTAMAPTKCSPRAARCTSPSAGAMSAARSTNSPRAVRRRSPPRLWPGSLLFTGSRPIWAAVPPTSAAPSARNAAARWSKHSSLGCARSCR